MAVLRQVGERLAASWWLAPAVAGAVLLWPALLGPHTLLPMDILHGVLPWSALGDAPEAVRNPLLRDLVDTYDPVQTTIWARIRGSGDPAWLEGAGLGGPGWWFVGTGALSPFVAPWYLLGVADRAAALGALARIAVGGAGVGVVVRAYGGGRLAAAVGGTCFATGGFMISWLGWPQSGVGACVGWVWWATRRAAAEDAPWWAVTALAAAVCGAWLAGFPAVTALLVASAGALAVAETGLFHLAAPRRLLRAAALPGLLRVAGGLAAGTCLAAVQLLPSLAHLDAMDLSARSDAWRGSLPLSLIARWVAPDLYGDGVTVAYWGRLNQIEGATSIGVAALVLALTAIVRRPGSPAIRRMGAMALVTGALVYGLPPLRALLQYAPGLRSNPPARGVVLTAAALAVLAGLGVDAARTRRTDERPGRGGWVAIGLLATVAAAVVVIARPDRAVADLADLRLIDPVARAAARELAIGSLLRAAGIAVTVMAAITLLRRWRPRWPDAGRAALLAIVVMLAVIEPVSEARGWNTIRPLEERYPPVAAINEIAAAVPPPARVAAPAGVLLPLTDLRYPLNDARGRGFVTGGQRALITAAGGIFASPTRWDLAPAAVGVTPALGALGVSAVLLPPGAPVPPVSARPTAAGVVGPLLADAPAIVRPVVETAGDAPVRSLLLEVLTFGRSPTGDLTVRIDTDAGPVEGSLVLDGVADGGLVEVPLGLPVGVAALRAAAEAGAVTVETSATSAAAAVAVRGTDGVADAVARQSMPWPGARQVGPLQLVPVPQATSWISLVDAVEVLPRESIAAAIAEDPEGSRDMVRAAAGSHQVTAVPDAAPAPEGDTGRILDAAMDGRRITATIDAPAGGAVLRVLEPDIPGWTATVDGVPAPVIGVDAAFIGVSVTAGRHEIVLRWRPPWLREGTGVSLATAALLLAWTLLRRRRGRSTRLSGG